jgi:hypothetical protein
VQLALRLLDDPIHLLERFIKLALGSEEGLALTLVLRSGRRPA